MEPADLIARLRRRDPEALAGTVREHARPLYRAARGMGLREEDAEDMAQEVLTTFLQTLDRFEGRSQIRTWLFGILHHKIRERRRELWREELQDPIDQAFESRFDPQGRWRAPYDVQRAVESSQIGQAIGKCLEELPGPQREVFVLREMEELETPEVCKILGVTVTNLGVLLHRARNRLRTCLEARGWKARS